LFEETLAVSIGGEFMKIGGGAPLTGLAAQLGREMMQTVQLAVEEANAGGGIRGLELELRVVDDEGNEEGGRRTALALSEDAAVLAVVGRYNSNVTLAAAPSILKPARR
jgi:branched-chain amino acid transport system substrate-binding protein